jgi:formylglycine-generating enzyme required for sulfatase activity
LGSADCDRLLRSGRPPDPGQRREAPRPGGRHRCLRPNLPAHEQLRKAVNDARAVGAALRELGFDATVAENLPRLAFVRAWQRFLNRLQPGDTAALFFAGHGVELGGLNYLLPRDVPKVVPGEDQVLAAAAIRFNELMDNLREKKVRVALFIVDACRDNPFRDGRGRSVGGARGLARIEAARGSFVMYSAGAGEQALDRLSDADPNPNSVYTRTLLPILKTPGLSLPEIAGRVRRAVVTVARGIGREQTPAYYDELLGEFVLKAGPDSAPVPPSPPACDAERAWAAVKDSTDIATLEAFRRQYGVCNALYNRLAETRIEPLRKQQLALLKAEEEKRRAEAELIRPGRVFRDCPNCPEMVVVPAGSFTMGSPESEPGREPSHKGSESPQHRVAIARPFAVGKFEVTRGEFETFVRDSGRAVGDKCHILEGSQWQERAGRSFRDPGFAQDARHPAVCVSWEEASAFVGWLSRKTGRSYRLLTEAEWEYVARAGTTTPYWWGPSISTSQANYDGRPKGEFRQKTVPVDSFAPNPWGLYNVNGNAWEWVQDCWNDNYTGAPSDGAARVTGDCGRRVVRGGYWGNTLPQHLRSASRVRSAPAIRSNGMGFRIGKTL